MDEQQLNHLPVSETSASGPPPADISNNDVAGDEQPVEQPIPGKPFPRNILQCIGIEGVYILVLVIVVILLEIIGLIPFLKPYSASILTSDFLTAVFTIYVLVRMKKRRELSLYKPPVFTKISITAFVLLILFILTLQYGVIDPIHAMMPDFDEIPLFKDMFEELLKNIENELIGYTLSAIILAPILEEYMYRELMLNGLMKSYSPAKALFISTFIFAFVHLNPWQFVTAMLLGYLLGWIYIRTRSYWLCVIVHMLNNAVPMLGGLMVEDDFKLPTWVVLIMLALVVPLFYLLRQKLPRVSSVDESVNSVE